jgi:hypothetical protein
MRYAINVATPRPAPIGTSKMAGLPINPAKKSDSMVVGSKVPAAISMDEDGSKAGIAVDVKCVSG